MTDLFTHTRNAKGCEAAGTDAETTTTSRRVGSLVCLLLVPLFVFSLVAMTVESADAKRFGGGRSFGSKPSHSSTYKKPAPAKDSGSAQRDSTQNQKNAAGAGTAASARPGFGGMLGGLLMGGLIGSMLFGGGFGGGLGILEMLIIGFLGYKLLQFFRMRKMATAGAGAVGSRNAYSDTTHARSAHTEAQDGWAALRTPRGERQEPSHETPGAVYGLDEAELAEGAKALFVRLQSSWDKRDVEDIRLFASPEVVAEIEKQAAEDPTPSKTEVLLVNARILESKQQDNETRVTVLYDALLREEQTEQQPKQVREVWHFRRDDSASKPEWTLEGLQQLAV